MKHILLLVALYFGACSIVQAEPPAWTRDEVRSSSSQTEYVRGLCSVSIHHERNEVLLSAYEYDISLRSRFLQQYIRLRENEDGHVTKFEVYVFRTPAEKYVHSPKIVGYTLIYDMFGAKCTDALDELPYEVKERFHGFYGVGSPAVGRRPTRRR